LSKLHLRHEAAEEEIYSVERSEEMAVSPCGKCRFDG